MPFFDALIDIILDHPRISIVVGALGSAVIMWFQTVTPESFGVWQKGLVAVALAAGCVGAIALVPDRRPAKAPETTSDRAPSPAASSDAPPAIPLIDPLTTEWKGIAEGKSCPLAKKFVANNKGKPQATEARTWVSDHCKPPAALAKPTLEAAKPPAPAPAPEPTKDPRILALQFQLARVKCYSGPLDGQWTPALRKAVNGFGAFARVQMSVDDPDAMLAQLQGTNGQICP